MWEAVKSVAFVLFSVMVALVLQAHAEFDEMESIDTQEIVRESITEQVQAQLARE